MGMSECRILLGFAWCGWKDVGMGFTCLIERSAFLYLVLLDFFVCVA